MNSVLLPGTTLNVSSICLGTGQIGTGLDKDNSFRLLDAYVERGGNFLDTAHIYGDWVKDVERSICEKTIGAWLMARGNRDQIVLATKGGHPYLDSMQVPRLSRQEIVTDLDASLQCLQTDYIDLYWLHRDDPTRPVEDILETLNAQVKAGKIRTFGASNWQGERMRATQEYATAQGLAGFVADQMLWNAAVLAKPPADDTTLACMDAELFAFHRETGMAAIPYQSQASGLFSRMHNGTLDQMNPGARGCYKLEESRQRYERMRQVMEETGLTITQVVLGYLISQPFTTVPIVGCRNMAQLTDSLSAANVRLTPEQVAFIGPAAQSF
jgi:aryl-alcohol dehydrogenase-like predicted oxidoreductase